MSSLWAKTDGDSASGRYHPLVFHMLDVAAVAAFVWDHCLTDAVRARLTGACGLGLVAHAKSLIVFLAGAHDIGKVCPGFQKKVPQLSENCELPFSANDKDVPHGFVTAHTLRTVHALLGQVAGGHHGVFPRALDLRMGRDSLGNNDWSNARTGMLGTVAKIVGFDLDTMKMPASGIADPYLVPVLGGLISVVDWIGSNQEFFPCAATCGCDPDTDPSAYWATAQANAKTALSELGWLPAVTFADESSFENVFSGFSANDLQRKVMALAATRTSSYLMIVEAPMGHGKTEAALYAADLAMCRGFARGMYVAMPTQATGNAMYQRVLQYLKPRGHQGALNLQLVHGNALLAQLAAAGEGEIADFNPDGIATEDGDVEAQSWFTARKRPLLAPFGVGTIDQSLLSVLQTRHWFVRLFGLAGKVVIFDEVHAYDAYMSAILDRLLRWLAEIDCTVVLLSATLPEAKRQALVKAYSGWPDAEHARYPRVTVAMPNRYQNANPNARSVHQPVCAEIPMGETREVSLHIAKTDLPLVTEMLAQELQHGGCAAVICNTVDRSIEIYRHLDATLVDTECLLFHARTLQVWRREREEEVLRKFGKGEKTADGFCVNPHRPKRAVLVATQVVEQSLDLDFDLMVSELAPVDLLLQRSGRLHRHPRRRPQGLESPRFVVLCDAESAGPPPESFGRSIEHVYDRYILLRTWQALRTRKKFDIPVEVESLIEAVYGNDLQGQDNGWQEALETARLCMESDRSESEKAARSLLVASPRDPADLVEEFNDQLADDEDPEVHRSIRAATRQGPPSVTVVVLPEGQKLHAVPGLDEVRNLLDRSVKLSHRGVFHAMLEHGECPKEWARNAHLRHARLLRLDDRRRVKVGSYTLSLDKSTGVTIDKVGDGDA